jgi:hypothetical protein
MSRGKSVQVSFREKVEAVLRIDDYAKVEDLGRADFVRKVFRYGLKEYETAGSLHAMRLRVDIAAEAKRQVALERAVQKKLDLEKRRKSEGAKKKRKAS